MEGPIGDREAPNAPTPTSFASLFHAEAALALLSARYPRRMDDLARAPHGSSSRPSHESSPIAPTGYEGIRRETRP
jgi:hypothetical protein